MEKEYLGSYDLEEKSIVDEGIDEYLRNIWEGYCDELAGKPYAPNFHFLTWLQNSHPEIITVPESRKDARYVNLYKVELQSIPEGDVIETINKPVEITKENVDNTLDSAFYANPEWVDHIQYIIKPDGCKYKSEALTMGGSIRIIYNDYIHDNQRYGVLTLDKFVKGMKKWMEHSGRFDIGDYDANDADACLQMALFGEVIFD